MKYLIFTDLHLSYNSSILPLSINDSKFTTRLDMCINTLKWVFEKAEEEKVDMIICGGDIFDSHMLRAEEITAMSYALSFYDNKIPLKIITGNHDILDKQAEFYSSALFKNYDNISVYNTPQKVNDELSVLPYMSFSNITEDLVKELHNKFLVSHIDIYGSILGNKHKLDFGVEPNLFNGFEKVFNGHIHTQQVLSENVMNIGSCVSHSFSDDEDYIPSILIYDSDNNTVDSIENPHAILFRTFEYSRKDFNTILDNIKNTNIKYVIRVNTNSDNRDTVNRLLNNVNNIIAYRVIVNNIVNSVNSKIEKIDINYDNLIEQFKEFLNNKESLKFKLDDYNNILNQLD